MSLGGCVGENICVCVFGVYMCWCVFGVLDQVAREKVKVLRTK